MALKFDFKGTDVQLVSRLRSRSNQLAEAVTDKMTYLMIKLRDKITSQKMPSSGVLDPNISEPEIESAPGKVTGKITWLGGTDYYVINPLGVEGTKGSFRELAGGKQGWRVGHAKGAITRTGSDVLHFMGKDGKEVFTKYVFHPPYPFERKMTEALDEMEDEIRNEISSTVGQVLKEIS